MILYAMPKLLLFNKMNKKYFLILFLFLHFSCKEEICIDDDKIEKKITSNSANDIVEGYYIIGECRRIKFIEKSFKNINDVRISHHIRYNGISVYKSKMIALKKISGLEPPVKLTNQPDSIIIAYYYRWAIKNNYIQTKSR